MRLRKQDLTRRVNGEITVKFTESGLTSYAGLELLIRYLSRTRLNELIRRHLGKARLKGDYSAVSMIRLIAGMLVAGGSRLAHVGCLRVDPVFLRFCNLARLLELRMITIDVDGTVVSAGMKMERAFRGYNPHHRKVPSYYPITAALAETGHVIRVKNRSGNVHDGKASMTFLRALFDQIRETLGWVLQEGGASAAGRKGCWIRHKGPVLGMAGS